ncbi:MAG: STAS domain-containing protein [Desulfobacteraceae bacterium]|nr:STAS domain-containing protein [Desulfobacteraceae bacterium]
MITTTEKIGDKMVIKILKDIDNLKSGEEFKSALMELYKKGEKEIVIDFGETRVINSHGIGKILMFYRRFNEIGGTIYVTPLKGSIKDVFEALMLDKLIKVINL